MNCLAAIFWLLGVLLLPDGVTSRHDAVTDEEFRLEADAGNISSDKDEAKSARIRAKRTDMDRTDGVIMFEDDVFIEYSTDYTMNSDRLFVFFKGTNTLSRIVASGGVVLTNETRTGECEMAVFRNLERRIEMFGSEKNPARLIERSGERSEVIGSKITFWIETEQVEVIAPVISVENKNVR